MTEIPRDIVLSMADRRDAKVALKKADEALQKSLTPYAGDVFDVEGTPVKVCGNIGSLYLRRIGPSKTKDGG